MKRMVLVCQVITKLEVTECVTAKITFVRNDIRNHYSTL